MKTMELESRGTHGITSYFDLLQNSYSVVHARNASVFEDDQPPPYAAAVAQMYRSSREDSRDPIAALEKRHDISHTIARCDGKDYLVSCCSVKPGRHNMKEFKFVLTC